MHGVPCLLTSSTARRRRCNRNRRLSTWSNRDHCTVLLLGGNKTEAKSTMKKIRGYVIFLKRLSELYSFGWVHGAQKTTVHDSSSRTVQSNPFAHGVAKRRRSPRIQVFIIIISFEVENLMRIPSIDVDINIIAISLAS